MRPAMSQRRRLLALTLAMGVAVSMAVTGTEASAAVVSASGVDEEVALTVDGPDEIEPPVEEDPEESPEEGEPTEPGDGGTTEPAAPDAESPAPDAPPTPEESAEQEPAEQEPVEEDVTDVVSVVPDPKLAEAINQQLDRPLDTTITVQDLRGLEKLQFGRVSSLEGLQYATSLQSLIAYESPGLEDLTPLVGLPLADFEVSQTSIRSVEALAGAPLQRVSVTMSPLESLKGLEAQAGIESLYFQDTLITDLSPLRGVPVQHLRLSNWSHEQALIDLSPLGGTTGDVTMTIWDIGILRAWSPVDSTTTTVTASSLPKSPDGTPFTLNKDGWPPRDLVEVDLTAHPRMMFNWTGATSESVIGQVDLRGVVAPRPWHQDPAVASAQQGFVGSEMQVQLRVTDAEKRPAAGRTINGPDEGPVVTWSVAGELPEGLTLSQDGVVSGTPTTLTDEPVAVEIAATDPDGNETTRTYTFEVLEPPVIEVDPELGEVEPPAGETPEGELPGETPDEQTPGGQTPGGQTPGGQTPGGQTPGGQTPGGQSGDQTGDQAGTALLGATPPASRIVDGYWLPNTGGPAWWLTLAGVGTVLAGGAVTWWARRRRLG